ncbi:MAG: hypothetical protein RL642_971 [Bacteroidota bacterium]|jgi:hypothetical protein
MTVKTILNVLIAIISVYLLKGYFIVNNLIESAQKAKSTDVITQDLLSSVDQFQNFLCMLSSLLFLIALAINRSSAAPLFKPNPDAELKSAQLTK